MGKMKRDATTRRIAGVILAGGSARRMGGIPKGMLQVGGHLALVERLIVHVVRSGIEEIVIAANDERPYAHLGRAIVPDRRTDAGPLAGIEAALEHLAGRCEAVLCLPCDLPALSSREISALLDAFTAHPGPVLFAETENAARHPLCAVIRSDLHAGISAALDEGARNVGDLWVRLGGSTLYFDDSGSFANLNSPKDVKTWLASHCCSGQAS